jgi:hypothetical protein
VTRAPAGPTRAQRRAEETNGGYDDEDGGRSRRGLVIAGVIAALLIVGVGAAFALGVFSGDSNEEAAPKASTNVKLEPGEVTVYWPGIGPGGAATAPELPDQVMSAIGEYVDNGIVPGLRTGKVKDADLSDAFDAAALAKLAGDDRAVLLDEGLPKAIGKLTIKSTPTDLTVLNDAQGATLLVSAVLDLDIRVVGAKGAYDIKRTGQLEFAPDGAGGWKITGWDVDVSRTGKGLPVAQHTPTTATTATTAAGAAVTTTTVVGTP